MSISVIGVRAGYCKAVAEPEPTAAPSAIDSWGGGGLPPSLFASPASPQRVRGLVNR
jgi:hypothetical protein